ncbi:MAG: sodium:proton antiporter [Leptospiraceae bacterium]|nr:sodium:proton antiporter [Leptospiraceae bacterium]
MNFRKLIGSFLVLGFCASLSFANLSAEESGTTPTPTEHKVEGKTDSDHSGHHESGKDLEVWTVIPFVLLLLCIAVFPVASHSLAHWWEHNNNKLIVSLLLGGISFGILIANGWSAKIIHTVVFDYIPFIILLTSLFYISGGIVLRGDIHATPVNNLIFLIVGSILASFIGTTGASMLLIRPLLKTNSERKHVVHTVVFFIFMVSNIGGSLTPLGDPPLFLGYLQGVPFTWTFNLFPEWVFALVVLSIVYFIWDTKAYASEAKKDLKLDDVKAEPISIAGQLNFIWLLGVVLCAAFINSNYIPAILHNPYIGFLREAGMILLIILSKITSDPKFREENKFTLGPIQEVAYLFIGIFITMIPALILLEKRGGELGVKEPWQFYWASGIFSSVLDNAPTYLTFLSLAKGLLGTDVMGIVTNHTKFLQAISVGAVFMGANTYIGNAPNFMVKSVAEEMKVKMPSFGGYVLYSGGVLIPLFIIITFIFFL